LIDTGAQSVSRSLGVPIYLGDVVQAALLLVVFGTFCFTELSHSESMMEGIFFLSG
jgi:ABC-type uncharacterized transport system permease subunit